MAAKTGAWRGLPLHWQLADNNGDAGDNNDDDDEVTTGGNDWFELSFFTELKPSKPPKQSSILASQ